MKKIILSMLLLIAAVIVSNAQLKTQAPKPALVQVITEYDFGTIPQGKPVTYKFEFKNIGKDPLIIRNASASCACVNPNWTKEPILKGKSGFVEATYNAVAHGPFTKTVTVNYVGDFVPTVLTIKGTVQ